MSGFLFLSPHNDDETLFGAYILMRFKPTVIVCTRSFKEFEQWDNGPDYRVREAETKAACQLLLSDSYIQFHFADTSSDGALVSELEDEMRYFWPQFSHVFAPWPEEGGHHQHNLVGELARRSGIPCTFYTTYTHDRGRTRSQFLVPYRFEWSARKLEAMHCYQSQIKLPYTRVHFDVAERGLEEYFV